MNQEVMRISLDQQIERYERILKENPDDLSALMAYGEANLRRGKRLSALSAYQRIVKVKPDVLEAHLALARIYFLQLFYDAAFEELQRAFELDSRAVEGHLLYREMSALVSIPPQWAEALKPHLGLSPRARDLALYRRQLEIELGKLDSDMAEMDRALAASPDTILEYHRNMALQRRDVVRRLMEMLAEVVPAAEAPSVAAASPASPPVAPQPPAPAPPPVAAASPSSEAPAPSEAPREGLPDPKKVEACLEPLRKTRGVTGIFLTGPDGVVLLALGPAVDIAPAVLPLVTAAGRAVQSAGQRLTYWVAEYAQGLVVLQPITPRHTLVVVGQEGANFGAFKLALDKGRQPLASLLG